MPTLTRILSQGAFWETALSMFVVVLVGATSTGTTYNCCCCGTAAVGGAGYEILCFSSLLKTCWWAEEDETVLYMKLSKLTTNHQQHHNHHRHLLQRLDEHHCRAVNAENMLQKSLLQQCVESLAISLNVISPSSSPTCHARSFIHPPFSPSPSILAVVVMVNGRRVLRTTFGSVVQAMTFKSLHSKAH